MTVKEKLIQLRVKMSENGIDAYIIPSSDSHLSEYVADYYKSRAFMSGFTGSAGTLIVTKEEAFLWADGRYFIQAERELEGSSITLFKMGQNDVPTITEWLNKASETAFVTGYDGKLFSYGGIQQYKKKVKNKVIEFKDCGDLIQDIWKDRPALPSDKVFEHTIEYTGKDVSEKLKAIYKKMDEEYVDYYVMSSLNDIAWLFNIRGNDVLYTPVAYAYAMISKEEALLFIDLQKIDEVLKAKLGEQGVIIKDYNTFYEYLKAIEEATSLAFDPSKVNEAIINHLDEAIHLVEIKDFTTYEKAVMNEVEIKNYRNCQVKDGVAMVKFLTWLDGTLAEKELTELDVIVELEKYRAKEEGFIEPSFDTIAAYGGNAAMMHYQTSESNPTKLEKRSLFLLDSGGQYYDGTTDITRTIALGELTDEEETDFTLVLKGHIALSRVIFLKGTTGTQLDAIARQAIWQQRMDYKSGTGHSVGYLLGVHEGPQRISPVYNGTKLQPGMIVTNEPGIYKEDKYGIRIENILLVSEDETNDMGTFYYFEDLTYCPIDLNAVKVDLLTEEEIKWLNDYHQKVYDILSERLSDSEKVWLKNATRPIENP